MVVLVAATAAAACAGSPGAPSGSDARSIGGTVRFVGLEGGFWTIAGDDGVTYDPHESLPASFRQNGLPVRATVRVLTGAGCIHMVGPIVEITEIR